MTHVSSQDAERQPSEPDDDLDKVKEELDDVTESAENESLAEHDIPAIPDAVPTEGTAALP